jgi:hypothetical protein
METGMGKGMEKWIGKGTGMGMSICTVIASTVK